MSYLSAVLCVAVVTLAQFPVVSGVARAQDAPEHYSFDDLPTGYLGGHPDWFKVSFLDLREDLDEALEAGKSGIIIYFGQKHCAYCKAMMEENLSKPDVVAYVTRHFDVIGLNVFSTVKLTDPEGNAMTVKEYAVQEKTHFTPSLIFFGKDRKKALVLRGYHPAYKMRAALEYVADGHYRKQSFRDYLAKADPPLLFEGEALNHDDLFISPPYVLDRSHFQASRPMLVIFEQPKCHACDILHSEPLQNKVVRQRLQGYEVVQLNVWDRETPVLTPGGERLTPFEWAVQLKLSYTPTLLLFDERGQEIMRIESVVQFFRLAGILRYVAEKGYIEDPVFYQWKRKNIDQEREAFADKLRNR
ncbi:MAG: thioredoxin fold domain-containing protein [Gammaproteobacteria bacterium]|nr:thioredoxin fold domain-containing protein [Gammaproteobacteria bacterium]